MYKDVIVCVLATFWGFTAMRFFSRGNESLFIESRYSRVQPLYFRSPKNPAVFTVLRSDRLMRCYLARKCVVMWAKRNDWVLRPIRGGEGGWGGGEGGTPTDISHILCASPKGMVFPPFWSENVHRFCFSLVWNQAWFSRELRECISVFAVLIPNKWERTSNMRIGNVFWEIFFGVLI